MTEVEELKKVQNGEKILPIFLKKKVLPLDKMKELQETVKEFMKENDELIANEELMLEKIRVKDNEFIASLEEHLELFKMANIEKIILKSDMLPPWSQGNESSGSADANIHDVTHRLVAWYETMATYVSMQREGVNLIVSDWFSQLDKIVSKGEPDPRGTEVPRLSAESSLDFQHFSSNISWYIILILFCVLNMLIFYKPEDINQCINDGFCKCFVQNTMKVGVFLHDNYLRFHNIPLDCPSMLLGNISTDNFAQCSSNSKL